MVVDAEVDLVVLAVYEIAIAINSRDRSDATKGVGYLNIAIGKEGRSRRCIATVTYRGA